jgi:hypothetical protein
MNLVNLVADGRSLVIEIIGRLISQRHCTRSYVLAGGRSLVMWDAFHHPVSQG